ncbi:Bax inhibitor-1/YccA family protein [Sporosarcina sp. ACRSL]|uniref:Bax inhibitor-1/YccA family protein n=1 Tax=Sporosarcina sp. ACRSL TaxID=2918215 RepID=UPI001EF55937|nr:Bax inhibitor-1/YccA family protein [Sporosarcina sp. ACRSL]MCG7346314.1 Bax inhibitor-1/YccA family protein [Sporosarcina sp. ACRSL]
MRSANPSLREDTFKGMRSVNGMAMTIQGTVNKTFILFLLLCVTAVFTWYRYYSGNDVSALVWIGFLLGFVVALVTIFVKRVAPFTAPLYALLEGLAIGGISAMFEAQFAGITIQAVLLTFGTLFSLLVVYRLGLIEVTKNFRLGVVAATGAIFFVYLIDLILRFFGMEVPFIHETGLVGIAISVIIVIVAALNLVLDFDFIESGAAERAPKFMEWYGAFGLMVTLIWLYLEILRLLAKVRSNK